MDAQAQSSFVRSRLPWVVAASALVLYLVTLNRWISLNSLQAISVFMNPDAAPPLNGPLLYLVTLPLRLLPAGVQLVAFNVLSAVFAALTLALLARSVALLPHDRTREERHRPPGDRALLRLKLSWLPPVLAALVLGLQLSFWEHATAGTGNMLSLLLLAYIIRCLLEFRIDPRESWLTRMALVYGLATVNNYAMIACFPLVLTALIWIRGMSFFRAAFLLRMTLWGSAGLLLYFVAPLVILLQNNTELGFWETLRYEMVIQYRTLRASDRIIVLFGSMTSIVPLLLVGIRWPSTFGDTSAFGNLLINYAFRVVYGVFAAFILWMMLGAEFAPRALMESKAANLAQSFALPAFLPLYYVAAMVLGYILGYFLLVFGQGEVQRHRRRQAAPNPLNLGAAALPSLASVAVAGLLVWHNLPLMRHNNGLALKSFAKRAVQSLPDEPAVVLADHPQMLALVNVLVRQQNQQDRYLLVNSGALSLPTYQRTLHSTAPQLWPDYFAGTNLTHRVIPDDLLMVEIGSVAAQAPTFYLHSSFGYFFETVYQEPRGLIMSVKSYPTNLVEPPLLAPEALNRNQLYWEELWKEIEPLVGAVKQGSSDAFLVARWYAQALNCWGVALQRNSPEHLQTSALLFSQAKQLNPDNVASDINLRFNRSLQEGTSVSLAQDKSLEQLFGLKYRGWDDLVRLNGPVDDPIVCLSLGRRMLERGLRRQAIIELQRSVAVAPPDQKQKSRFWLAEAFTSAGLFDKVFETLRVIDEQSASYPIPPDQQQELYRLESVAIRARDQSDDAAIAFLTEKLAQHRESTILFDALVSIYLEADQTDRAVALVDKRLAEMPKNPRDTTELELLLLNKAVICMHANRSEEAGQALLQLLARNPDNKGALLNQGALFIQTQRFEQAVAPLSRLLDLDPENRAARLNRAIALLKSDKLDEAEQDYRQLVAQAPRVHAAHFGLAEIAWQRKDYTSASEHYEAYLKTAPPNTDEAREVAARLESIKSGKL